MLDEFLLADDMANGAPTEEKMQKGVDQVSDSCDSYDHNQHQKDRGGLSTSTWQALQGAHHYSERSKIASGRQVDYLGSTLSRVVHIDDEGNARIAKARAAFGRLRGSVCDRSGIRLDTIVCMRNVDSLPTARQKTEPIPYKLSYKTFKD